MLDEVDEDQLRRYGLLRRTALRSTGTPTWGGALTRGSWHPLIKMT
jgi:hypothetical protein